MGLGLKVFVILICASFLFAFAPRPCSDVETEPCVGFGNYYNTVMNITGNPLNPGSYFNSFYGQLLGATIVGAAVAIFFPNPYTIFAAFALFLLNFAVVPYDLLASASSYGFSASDPLILFISGIFGLLLVVAAVTFYKGNEW